MSGIPERSSGENWSRDEDDQLRQLWLALVEQMPGRSEAAVAARLNLLRERHYKAWPHALREPRW